MYKALTDVLFSNKLTIVGGKDNRSVLEKLIDVAVNEVDSGSHGQERLHACRSRIQSLTMCEKLVKYVYSSRKIKDLFRNYAESENCELVVTIVRSAEDPRLDKYDLGRIMKASRVYQTLLKKHRNRITRSMTEDINVRLILDLKLYLRLISQERDSRIIKEMLEDETIREALKVLIEPLGEILKRVYKVGNGSQVIEDIEKFLGQLITIIDALRSRIQDPQKSIRILSKLLAKHQQGFYNFFYRIHRQDSTIEEFFEWASKVILLLKNGFQKPIRLSELIPSSQVESLTRELDELVEWEKLKRQRQYEQVCRRYSSVDVDGDDSVIVEGDGFGKSKVEPMIESKSASPKLDQIARCLQAFRIALTQTLKVGGEMAR